MLYSFARVSAVVAMRRQDYFRRESRGWLRLHAQGGEEARRPRPHHRAAEALDHYVEAGGLDEAKAPLFQSFDPAARRLTGSALSRRLVLAIIQAAGGGCRSRRRRPAATRSGRRGSRRTCRTGGPREHAQRIVGHRVAEDDEALRPDGGHNHHRRD